MANLAITYRNRRRWNEAAKQQEIQVMNMRKKTSSGKFNNFLADLPVSLFGRKPAKLF